MTKHYTDAEVQTAIDSVTHKEILDPPFRALSGLMSYQEVEQIVIAVLDAAGPAIAARALREAGAEMAELAAMDPKDYPHKFGMQDAAEILRERADDVEAGR